MMKPFHYEELPLNSIMGLIQQGAGGRHLRVRKHRIPARLLGLKPASHACAIGGPRAGGVVGPKTAVALPPPPKHPALSLGCPRAQSTGIPLPRPSDPGSAAAARL